MLAAQQNGSRIMTLATLSRRSVGLLTARARVGLGVASPVFGCLAVWLLAVLSPAVWLFGLFPTPGGCSGHSVSPGRLSQLLFSPRRPRTSFLADRLFGCFDTRTQLFPRCPRGVPAVSGPYLPNGGSFGPRRFAAAPSSQLSTLSLAGGLL